MIEPAGLVSGLIIGILFGFVLQRGRFCMNSAFRDIILLKDYTLLKMVGVALIVGMIGFHAMANLGTIQLNPKPFFWGANILGGLIFGAGMVFAAGCASGTTYRVGEGMVGSFVALLGFMMSAVITANGSLKGVTSFLQSTTKITISEAGPLVTSSSTSPTLANIVGIDPWIAVIIIALVGTLVLIWKREDEEKTERNLRDKFFKHGWSWWTTGIAIGIISIIAFPASAATGRNYPLGITGGWKSFLNTFLTGNLNNISWETLLVVGVVFGGAIAALLAGEFKLRAPGPKMLIQQFTGGVLMGVGAIISSGCNIGHILSGIPQLSIGSIIGGLFIVFGAWVTAYLMFMRE